ncbi:MAG: hypothetical protein ACJ79R_03635 [Anaeromyxobacteraceae bacterium]
MPDTTCTCRDCHAKTCRCSERRAADAPPSPVRCCCGKACGCGETCACPPSCGCA